MTANIYLISCHGKPVYVGFTSTSLEQRWKSHCKTAKQYSYILSKAIRKYGEEAFDIILIAEHTDEDFALNILEPMYIAAYGTHMTQGGYNMTWGGDKPPSWEGKVGPNKGKKVSDEIRCKMSEAHKGKVGPNKGKRQSDESNRKRSQTLKGRVTWNIGRKASDETRRKMSEARHLYNQRSKS